MPRTAWLPYVSIFIIFSGPSFHFRYFIAQFLRSTVLIRSKSRWLQQTGKLHLKLTCRFEIHNLRFQLVPYDGSRVYHNHTIYLSLRIEEKTDQYLYLLADRFELTTKVNLLFIRFNSTNSMVCKYCWNPFTATLNIAVVANAFGLGDFLFPFGQKIRLFLVHCYHQLKECLFHHSLLNYLHTK